MPGHLKSVSDENDWSPKEGLSPDRSPVNVFAAVQADTSMVLAAVNSGHSLGVSVSRSWTPRIVFAAARLVTIGVSAVEKTVHPR